ncbi:N-(5'-phosphoribosyl)anthranilate isomerase [Haloarcula marismortui ATCC 43049]|uniref:N-(5'-phosphoribosyl)anthranilate isomerase n=2 Tax=Haloarcula marismortui (strain ATCC 43049 / DSM 3752 / JCM 8966 / VKM B-1809) TaxID=272569 RepID=TRPF_HALMA|nr:phosphoribosylanthranilate isomerase [Haloarcula marismortui]Q5V212.1 RecName: Full=N-(5'-phosphoribosyl)anthranilate isomerase; Short=PRAI [Haloarcula marismortui ATCC 43049]AAV46440.1 N-(5'-phosphoribosyl)anthranilate isomerase [Haloarcula marismortui ATCC 43049]QCP91166.1 phosphoribosylanthranilate isomerase [Haloarcula marismortui ATCC 43049]
MTRVKICGVTDTEDRDAVVTAGADAVGIIHGVPVDTPREVDEGTAETIADGVPPFVTSVLVMMPTTVQEAVRRIDRIEPDAVQVHDGLSPAELGALNNRITQDIVAVVEADAPAIEDYATHADALLVDSVDADGGGGTGETHDWERTRDLVDSLDVPIVLAGGLTPENVTEAVETVEPFAVDVASGVESAGGTKDHDAVGRFVRNAKQAPEGAV